MGRSKNWLRCGSQGAHGRPDRNRTGAASAMALAIVSLAALFGVVSRVPRQSRVPIDLGAGVSAILVEAASGEVLYEHQAERKIPPASLTKLMTVLLAVEAVDSGQADMLDLVTVSKHAASMGGSQVWLGEGERYTLGQLLESVIMVSANDSAVAVAEHLAGSESGFVRRMTRRANELGMKHTRFVNASGLPGERDGMDGYTTASDMALLAREVLRHRTILEWSRTRSRVFRSHPLFVMENTNTLLGTYPGCDGLKTGHTEAAGYHLIATAKANGVRLVSVVMHARSDEARATGCARLLDLGFAMWRARDKVKNTAH